MKKEAEKVTLSFQGFFRLELDRTEELWKIKEIIQICSCQSLCLAVLSQGGLTYMAKTALKSNSIVC